MLSHLTRLRSRFLRNPDKVEAISTNSDIFVMPLTGGAPKNITVRNRGYDAGPVYTRDGKFILYRSQATAGFEADRWRLMAYNRATGASVELTKGFDLQVEEVVLSPDGNTIYFTAGDRGKSPIFGFRLAVACRRRSFQMFLPRIFGLRLTARRSYSRRARWRAPAEIYTSNADGTGLTALTSVNSQLMSRANLKTGGRN